MTGIVCFFPKQGAVALAYQSSIGPTRNEPKTAVPDWSAVEWISAFIRTAHVPKAARMVWLARYMPIGLGDPSTSTKPT